MAEKPCCEVVRLQTIATVQLCSCTVLNQRGRIMDWHGRETILCSCALENWCHCAVVQLYSIKSEREKYRLKWWRTNVVRLCTCELLPLCSCAIVQYWIRGRELKIKIAESPCYEVVHLQTITTVQLCSCTILNQRGRIMDQNSHWEMSWNPAFRFLGSILSQHVTETLCPGEGNVWTHWQCIESEGENYGLKWLRNHVVQLCSYTVLNQRVRIIDQNGWEPMLCTCAVVN